MITPATLHCILLLRTEVDHLEALNPVVTGIGDIDIAIVVDDNTVQVSKLAVSRAFLAPCVQKLALLIEDLDTIVAKVAGVDIVELIERNTCDIPKLPRTAARATKR